MSTEFPAGDFQDNGGNSGGALRAWAEKVNEENKALAQRLGALEAAQNAKTADELFKGYDPIVKDMVPEGANAKEWLEKFGDHLPKVENSQGAEVQAGQAGAPMQAQAQVPENIQGLAQIDQTMAQNTATGPGGVTQFGQANLTEALQNGGLAELNKLLGAQNLSGRVV
jgi:hypothetical protein